MHLMTPKIYRLSALDPTFFVLKNDGPNQGSSCAFDLLTVLYVFWPLILNLLFSVCRCQQF